MVSQVFYVMSGIAHLPYLAVSLLSLRTTMPDTDVLIYAYPEVHETCSLISDSVGVSCRVFNPEYRGKNDQFIAKQVVAQDPSADVKLYLDADTMVMQDLSYLVSVAREFGFVATQFNDWTTQGIVRERICTLVGRDGIPQLTVQSLLDLPWVSVNGGVWACRPESHVLPLWHQRTMSVCDMWIADEKALHTFVPEGQICVATTKDCNICWNTSPIYAPAGAEVAVWHFHGDSCCRPDKSRRGMELWMPLWQKCLKEDYAACSRWAPEAIAANKHMRKL